MLIMDHEILQAVIAKRKRKEERKRLREAAAEQGQRPETSQGSVVGRTTSAPEIVVLPDVGPIQRLPESQTPNLFAPNSPAIRKKPKSPRKTNDLTWNPCGLSRSRWFRRSDRRSSRSWIRTTKISDLLRLSHTPLAHQSSRSRPWTQ
jgi:hypothetical protein